MDLMSEKISSRYKCVRVFLEAPRGGNVIPSKFEEGCTSSDYALGIRITA